MAEKSLPAKPLVEDFWKELLSKIDLRRELRRAVFDGYETYEDYVKYGDMFPPLNRRS